MHMLNQKNAINLDDCDYLTFIKFLEIIKVELTDEIKRIDKRLDNTSDEHIRNELLAKSHILNSFERSLSAENLLNRYQKHKGERLNVN